MREILLAENGAIMQAKGMPNFVNKTLKEKYERISRIVVEEMDCQSEQEKDPNKKPPSQADMYMESRKRTPGHTYLTPNKDTLKNIEKMTALQSLNDESREKDPNYDPYPEVMAKKEHSGRLCLYGGGVTKSKLKSKDANTPFIVPQVFLEAITEQMQKLSLNKFRKI